MEAARRYRAVVVGLLLAGAMTGPAGASDLGQYRTADGLAVYLGLLPAAMLKGHPREHTEGAMHGGAPAGRHAWHLTVAVFDAASGARVGDAKVEARVSELGLAGPRRRLEPMTIGEYTSGPAPYAADVRSMGMGGGESVPVSTGQIQVNLQVSVTYVIK